MASQTDIPYHPPTYKEDGFNCPFCQAYANQRWHTVSAHISGGTQILIERLDVCYCDRCGKESVWWEGQMIVPAEGPAPPPHPDLPDDIKADYNEARSIVAASPRGAAALLRLCIQKICDHLGHKGKDINDAIAELVKQGLPVEIQEALDTVRVVGNHAVHPGQIDLNDNADIANELFGLVNFIVQDRITRPRAVREIYAKVVPQADKDRIAKRDGKAP